MSLNLLNFIGLKCVSKLVLAYVEMGCRKISLMFFTKFYKISLMFFKKFHKILAYVEKFQAGLVPLRRSDA